MAWECCDQLLKIFRCNARQISVDNDGDAVGSARRFGRKPSGDRGALPATRIDDKHCPRNAGIFWSDDHHGTERRAGPCDIDRHRVRNQRATTLAQ